MKKVLCYDSNRNFTSDIEMQLLLNKEDFDIDLIARNSLEKLKEDVERVKPDEVVLAVPMLSSRPTWDNVGVPVASFARNASEAAESEEKYHIPCYGIVSKAETLIELIIAGNTILKNTTAASSISVESSAPIPERKGTPVRTVAQVSRNPKSKNVQSNTPSENRNVQSDGFSTSGVKSEAEQGNRPNDMEYNTPYQSTTENSMHPTGDNQNMPPYNQNGYNGQMPQYPNGQMPQYPNGQMPQYPNGQMPQYPNGQMPQYPNGQMPQYPNGQMPQYPNGQMPYYPPSYDNYWNGAAIPPQMTGAAYDVERDMGNIKKPAKLAAVYSAKGGVGKTTITCNLATYLALTEHHGRDRYRVCIVDFNIDFGDVATTLGLDPNKGCMTQWANNIKQHLKGITPENDTKYSSEQLYSVVYTENQIKDYLQKMDETGLYVLLAPISNEDSMYLTENEIEVMLNNLINYGGFDFIICDTGNNTRDSSFIPLTKADEVYVVMNQSATTANCNAGFLNTMYKIGYDLNKIHILINMAMSYKSTGIAIDEIREAFINPYTKKPYDIIGILKDYDDVRNHNNMQQPLVYNSKHEYTKCIGEIANKLIGDNSILKTTEKPKFKLFGKRKR